MNWKVQIGEGEDHKMDAEWASSTAGDEVPGTVRSSLAAIPLNHIPYGQIQVGRAVTTTVLGLQYFMR